MKEIFLKSAIKQFEYYKMLGDKTFEQVNSQKMFYQFNNDSNSIAIIVQHLHGNMMSRWTNFLNEDGEKNWRNRDAEFEVSLKTKEELIEKWNIGWQCLFDALNSLKEEDLEKIIYIRNQGQTVVDAINRQLCHYSYHVGQIVFLGKMLSNGHWQSLSIAKGNSKTYNNNKFSQPKQNIHFTDEFLK